MTKQPKDSSEVSAAVGMKVMDSLNEAAGAPIATMGKALDDGSYEFLIGPVYLPSSEVSLTAPTETRQLFANLRLERLRAQPRTVQWLCRRGDGYAQLTQPTAAIVIDGIEAPPGEDVLIIKYHLSRA